MKKRYVIFFISLLCVATVCAQRGFDRKIKSSLFVPKGTWMGGCSFSYSEQTNDNYKFLVLDNVKASGYNFKVSPYAGYFFADNMAAGARLNYSRSYTDIGNLDLDLGDDLTFDIKDYKYLEHTVYASGFLRTYMGLGNSKIFGFFNELRLSYGYGQGKNTSGVENDLTGTYQYIHRLQLGSAPGLTAFVTNNIAVEVSIGLVGLDFKWINQKTNQVESGYRRNSSANFKIDIFSLNIGMCFYL
ncbi:hypothetical protein [Bacteroides sp.]|uniref:hypothetical protein n=1 Tax=Bacteroides sp. TaxID=29523 RepID=UPI0026039DF8|nr:hypothetical protein [Bacteroides sp.]MDD3038355.1 hypothetical protein [Bacteroides sp.]